MKFKNIPWFIPSFDLEEKKNISKVIDSNYLNEGIYVAEFEKKIAKLVDRKFCVCVTSGTIAIALSLMAFKTSDEDEVIIPNFTFIATANAAKLANVKIVFADINADRFDISITDIEKKITSKTKFIVPVDVNGRAADYKRIGYLKKKYGLKIITDSSEGFGSSFNKKKIGSFGDISCFSFSAAKTISTGQGGAIVTDDKNIYNKLLELKDQGRRVRGSGGDDLHPVIGYNFKYTNLQAAVGLSQLKKLRQRLHKFKKRDLLYRKYLSENENIIFPKINKDEILQWFDIRVKSKKKLIHFLKKKNIDVRSFWYPINSQKPYKTNEKFLNSRLVSSTGLWLPSYFDITKDEIIKVCKYINEFI